MFGFVECMTCVEFLFFFIHSQFETAEVQQFMLHTTNLSSSHQTTMTTYHRQEHKSHKKSFILFFFFDIKANFWNV